MVIKAKKIIKRIFDGIRAAGVSLIRTWVPIGVGALLAYYGEPIQHFLDLMQVDWKVDSPATLTATVAVTQMLWYAVVRFLEERVSSIGWLNGLNVKPVYEKVQKEAEQAEIEDAAVVVEVEDSSVSKEDADAVVDKIKALTDK